MIVNLKDNLMGGLSPDPIQLNSQGSAWANRKVFSPMHEPKGFWDFHPIQHPWLGMVWPRSVVLRSCTPQIKNKIQKLNTHRIFHGMTARLQNFLANYKIIWIHMVIFKIKRSQDAGRSSVNRVYRPAGFGLAKILKGFAFWGGVSGQAEPSYGFAFSLDQIGIANDSTTAIAIDLAHVTKAVQSWC